MRWGALENIQPDVWQRQDKCIVYKISHFTNCKILKRNAGGESIVVARVAWECQLAA